MGSLFYSYKKKQNLDQQAHKAGDANSSDSYTNPLIESNWRFNFRVLRPIEILNDSIYSYQNPSNNFNCAVWLLNWLYPCTFESVK